MNGDKDVTIVIKTFIRISCIDRLLASIVKYACECPIIICDDGSDATENKSYILSKYQNLNINYIITEQNIGLSKGRNILVENVKTKYFILCDDDFVFFKKTNIRMAKELISREKLDILGGVCLHAYRVNFGSKREKISKFLRSIQQAVHYYRKVGYSGVIKINEKDIIIKNDKINYNSKNIILTDICENFFIANTKKVRDLKWYEKLKLNEHEDFFIRAKKAGFKIGIIPTLKVYHLPETNSSFSKHRNKNYYMDVLKNNNIKELTIIRNNVGIVQTYKLLDDGRIDISQSYTKNSLGKLKKLYYTKIKK